MALTGWPLVGFPHWEPGFWIAPLVTFGATMVAEGSAALASRRWPRVGLPFYAGICWMSLILGIGWIVSSVVGAAILYLGP